MKISEHLQSVTQIFLDTAPVIYFVEKNPRYVEVARVVFNLIDCAFCAARRSSGEQSRRAARSLQFALARFVSDGRCHFVGV